LSYGGNDIGVSGTAAEITAHVLADVRLIVGVAFVHASHSRHDLAGRAISALKRVIFDEGLLHGMKLAIAREPLDGRNSAALRCDRKCQAREDAPPIDVNRAGTTLAMIAAFFRSSELKVLTK
jgi:hypothetical protein